VLPPAVQIGSTTTDAAVYLRVASDALIGLSGGSPSVTLQLPRVTLPAEPYPADVRPSEKVYLSPLAAAESVALAKAIATALPDGSTAPGSFALRGGKARFPDVVHHVASVLRFYRFFGYLPPHLRLTVISTRNLFKWATPRGYEKYTSVISGGTNPWNQSYYLLPAHYYEAFAHASAVVASAATMSADPCAFHRIVGEMIHDEATGLWARGRRYWFVPPLESKARMSGLEATRFFDGNSAWHNPKMNTLLRAVGLPGAEWQQYLPPDANAPAFFRCGKWVNTDVHGGYGTDPANNPKVVPHTPPHDIPWEGAGTPPEGVVRAPQPQDSAMATVRSILALGGSADAHTSVWLNPEDIEAHGADFIVDRAASGGVTTLIVTLKTTFGHVFFQTAVPPAERIRPVREDHEKNVQRLIQLARAKGIRVFGGFATLEDSLANSSWHLQQAGTTEDHLSPCNAAFRQQLETMLGEMLKTYSLDGVVLGQLFWGDINTNTAFITTNHGCDTSRPGWQGQALTDLAKSLVQAIHAAEPGLPVWLTGHPFRPRSNAQPDQLTGEQDFAALAAVADGWMVLASDATYLAQQPDPIVSEVGRLQALLAPVLESTLAKRFALSVSLHLSDDWTFPAAFYDGMARRMRGLGVAMSLHSPISADGDAQRAYAFTRNQWEKVGDLSGAAKTHNVLVLDRSGSMLADGKIEAAHGAARLYVDLIPNGDRLGAVSFADDALPESLNRAPAAVTGEPVRSAVKQFLTGIRPPDVYAQTSIGDGIERARQMLTSDPKGARVMVLLSDGLENQPRYWDRVGPKQLPGARAALLAAQPRIAVHTVALGKNADQKLLETIARETGGTYHYVYVGHSLSLDSRLTRAYSEVSAAIEGQERIYSDDGVLVPGEIRVRTVAVPGGAGDLTLQVSWPEAGQSVSVAIENPTGATDLAIPGSVRRQDPHHVVFQVPRPEPGYWTVTLAPHAEPGEYLLMALADTGLSQSLELDPLITPASGTSTRIGGRLRVGYGALPAASVSLAVSLEQPDRSSVRVAASGSDGTFSFSHPIAQGGSYVLRWTAEGVDRVGWPYRLDGERSFYYGYPLDRDGDEMRDAWESEHGLDPTRDDRLEDPDGDQLSNFDEHQLGTDPHLADTDGDGTSDGEELERGTHPLEPDRGALAGCGPFAAALGLLVLALLAWWWWRRRSRP
jgi:Mg-chelatase subunit ChlD